MFCVFDADLLRGFIKLRRYSQKRLAKATNISPRYFSDKMTGKVDWKLSEIQSVCRILDIADPLPIFFPRIKGEQGATDTPLSR